jgi:RES domain-containing protein
LETCDTADLEVCGTFPCTDHSGVLVHPHGLDLTSPAIRRALEVTLAELAAEDWRKLLAAGKESFTHALGRAVAATNGSGLLCRSAAVRRGLNVVIFPGHCATDRLEVVEGLKLEKLVGRTKV